MNVTEFLLARVAEDEAQAHELIRRQRRKLTVRDASLGYTRAFDPKRIAAECEAKRRIVAMDGEQGMDGGYVDGYYLAHDEALRVLAAVYSDHPDYDPAWQIAR